MLILSVSAIGLAAAAIGGLLMLSCGEESSCRCAGDSVGVNAVQTLIDSCGGTSRWDAMPVLAWRSSDGAFQVWDRRGGNIQYHKDALIVTHYKSETTVFDANGSEWEVRGQRATDLDDAAMRQFWFNVLETFIPYILCDAESRVQQLEGAGSTVGEIRLRFSGAYLDRAGFTAGVVSIDRVHWRVTAVELFGARPVTIKYSRWQTVGGLISGVTLGNARGYGVQVLDDLPNDLMILGRQ